MRVLGRCRVPSYLALGSSEVSVSVQFRFGFGFGFGFGRAVTSRSYMHTSSAGRRSKYSSVVEMEKGLTDDPSQSECPTSNHVWFRGSWYKSRVRVSTVRTMLGSTVIGTLLVSRGMESYRVMSTSTRKQAGFVAGHLQISTCSGIRYA
eukprot:872960-Rhodomonas_salina.3